MQLVLQSQEKFSSTKLYESITVTCNDNGVARQYEFENITASQALANICALYAKKDIKIIKFKNKKDDTESDKPNN